MTEKQDDNAANLDIKSRKRRYQYKKSKTLTFIELFINNITSLWNIHGHWILLGTIMGTVLALPGWLYIIDEFLTGSNNFSESIQELLDRWRK
ncbi:hypothetical protein [Psychrobacillus sp. MER TA 171]|uniref:hypothetical protein n=1 Tax=Psychrobacillus sp. MER TA 171 TaxID=2939577 RepID=UPI00203BAC8F|nr:hypothetical protein [Psychrobacillus sp. MER TA 171]MCM3358082.1 hypothetical protein [Psychrobacillus sp. MER TA 171]